MTVKCPECRHDNPEGTSFCGKCGTKLGHDAGPTLTAETPRKELTTGSTFADRYQIIEELGKGGMGRVYKAIDKEVNAKIALKLIKPGIASNKKTIERFRNELKVARDITHKNVCRMYDLNREEDSYFITMEYVSGEDLKNMIRMSGQLGAGTAIKIATQVCEGLAEAHKLGVVHRDLKPSNIMIDRDGNVRIMDFGIARSLKSKGITDKSVMIGTPEYMSPEQVEGKEVDPRSDIYSLGVILYEMVTGQVPFEGDTAFTIGMKHKAEQPNAPQKVNPQVPPELNDLIMKCLEKDKKERWQSAYQILAELIRLEKDITTTKKVVPEKKPETTLTGEVEWQNSIAVLPFADLSPQKDQDYFCCGLAETLINSLSNIKDLRVVARTSAFSFKGKDMDIREIGKKLNVNTVLEGSIQKSNKRIRVTAQLINVADGYHIWSDRYDREMEDIFAIQDEIGLAIVENLKGKLLVKEREKMMKRHTDNPEAYSLYLKGVFFWNKRTAEGMKKGMGYFQKAFETDPSYALAYSGLADCYGILGFWAFLSPQDSFPKAKSLAEKALKIDDTLAEAHASLAWVRFVHDWDWAPAETGFKKAIKLNPGYAMAHLWYGVYLTAMGRHEEALKEMKRAQEIDPLSLMIYSDVGVVYYYQRHYEKAVEQFKRIIEMDPTFGQAHYNLAKAYIKKEMYEEAVESADKAHRLGIPYGSAELARMYAISGKKDQLKELQQELEEVSKKRYIPHICFTWFYHGSEFLDKAFEIFEKSFQEREPWLPFIKEDPFFDSFRSDPRYPELLKKMNLE